jgi:uncharacterized protein (TIGR01777 family)
LGDLNTDDLEGLDAIVHLSGRSIASWRWTSKIKREIEYSRLASTQLLCESLARMAKPPRTLICASAIGYYGDRGDELVDESGAPGFGFLAELCEKWEAATEPAREAGIRVVNLRIGLVLTSAGGVLRQMLTPFRLGLGGVLGTGRQYISWISLDDLLAVILRALYDDELAGPVNAVSPAPVTNREFTKTLGGVLRRPTLLSLPGPVLRGLFGEMGRALFLQGARVRPAKLEAAAFDYLHRDLHTALRCCSHADLQLFPLGCRYEVVRIVTLARQLVIDFLERFSRKLGTAREYPTVVTFRMPDDGILVVLLEPDDPVVAPE